MEYVLSIIEIVSQFYGEVYQGRFDEARIFYPKSYLENIFYLLPSWFTHKYGELYPYYLFSKNDQLILSQKDNKFLKSNEIMPPILEIKVNDNDVKEEFSKFNLRTPLWSIFSYYLVSGDKLYLRYLKNDITTKILEISGIEEKSLGDIMMEN